jgi:hypothetical protein
MAPSCDETVEAIGEGGISSWEANGPDMSGEGDRAAEAQECDVTLGAFLAVTGVGDDLGHSVDHCVLAEGVQLVGPQFYLIVFLIVFPAGRGAKALPASLIPIALWHLTPDSDLR